MEKNRQRKVIPLLEGNPIEFLKKDILKINLGYYDIKPEDIYFFINKLKEMTLESNHGKFLNRLLEGDSFISKENFNGAKLDEKEGIYYLKSESKDIPLWSISTSIEEVAQENNAVVDYQLFLEKSLINREVLQKTKDNFKELEGYFENI